MVRTLTNKLTSSSALGRLGSAQQLHPEEGISVCDSSLSKTGWGEGKMLYIPLSAQSLTQEIGLCYSAGSFTTFFLGGQGFKFHPRSLAAPQRQCLPCHGRRIAACSGKETFSLWFSQGNEEQSSRNGTIWLILIWSRNSKEPQYETGTTVTQLQALLRKEKLSSLPPCSIISLNQHSAQTLLPPQECRQEWHKMVVGLHCWSEEAEIHRDPH